jgi:hypothetical protein
MGYAATTILVYGIRISSEDAKKIYEDCKEDFQEVGTMFYSTDDILLEERHHPHRRIRPRERYYPNMYSEGTDSRIHDLKFEEGYSHVVGLYVASKGYAYNDNIEDYLMPNQMCEDNYNKYIVPMLEELEIEKQEPKILIVNQVW